MDERPGAGWRKVHPGRPLQRHWAHRMEKSAANPRSGENTRIMKNLDGDRSLSTRVSTGRREWSHGRAHGRARLTTRKAGGYHSHDKKPGVAFLSLLFSSPAGWSPREILRFAASPLGDAYVS